MELKVEFYISLAKKDSLNKTLKIIMMLTVVIIKDLFYSHPRKEKLTGEKETTPKLCFNDNPQIT